MFCVAHPIVFNPACLVFLDYHLLGCVAVAHALKILPVSTDRFLVKVSNVRTCFANWSMCKQF